MVFCCHLPQGPERVRFVIFFDIGQFIVAQSEKAGDVSYTYLWGIYAENSKIFSDWPTVSSYFD